jgi:hypothetical protein
MSDEFLKTIDMFLRDPKSIIRMTPREQRFLQKCVEKSKKHRPLSDYNVYVKDRLKELETTSLKPREKIKQIAHEWKHDKVRTLSPDFVVLV